MRKFVSLVNLLPEFCAAIWAFSPKATWERWFKTASPYVSNPLGGAREAERFGWLEQQRNPPRRCATAVAARHPSREGIFRRPAIHVQNSGTNLAVFGPYPMHWIGTGGPVRLFHSNFHPSGKSQILPVSGEATRADHGDRALRFGHELPL